MGEGLLVLGLLGIIIGTVGAAVQYVAYQSYKEHEAQKTAWRSLAQAKKLTYMPGTYLGQGGHVTGRYRGHQLWLASIPSKEDERRLTHLKLSGAIWQDGTVLSREQLQAANPAHSVERLLRPTEAPALPGEIKVGQAASRTVYYNQPGILSDEAALEEIMDLLAHLADGYAQVVAQGGEAIPTLQRLEADRQHPLHRPAAQLIADIGHETTLRLGSLAGQTYCRRCLLRCTAHPVRLSWWQTVTYYGCRGCGQSRELFQGQVVAVLDSNMAAGQAEQEDSLRVNWLARRELFDFDRVEIVQATDEQVERFAVQVGNDTDPARSYRGLPCRVSCPLSANTMRILQHTFGPPTTG